MKLPIRIGAATAIAASATLAANAAFAADSGFYVGANIGRATADFSSAELNNALQYAATQENGTLVVNSSSLSKSDTAWSADVGYKFMPNFALEDSYLDLGKVSYHADTSYTASGAEGSIPIAFDATVKSRGPALAAVGIIPFAQMWEVDGRVGVYYGKATADASGSFSGGGVSESISSSKSSLLAGAGGSYSFDGHWSIRVDHTYINGVGDSSKEGTANVNVVTAGVSYIF